MKIGIIGCGAYAISLASILENNIKNILMWTKIENEYNELIHNHTNLRVLNYQLNNKIRFTMDLNELTNYSDLIIIAIPAKYVKDTINQLQKYYLNQEILIATKGMINDDLLLIDEYIKLKLNTNKISCISGPSFANDIIKKMPIGLTLASENNNSLNILNNIFSNIKYISIENLNDITTIELSGILKNIIAIAAGILNGMNINPSTKTKFLCDMVYEIQNIISNFNGNKKNFYTYAGIGDYLLTTTNIESRNYTFGTLIGENKDTDNYIKINTIEGIENLHGMYFLLKKKGINSEIINILYEIIYNNKDKVLLIDYLSKKRKLSS